MMNMRIPRRAALLAAGAVLLTALSVSAEDRRPLQPEMVFGSPTAAVSAEPASGAPVSGDTLTLAPRLAPLAPGTSTHEVEIDVVARELEIAPGVRYRAWTFGGSVPGPVLHVRQGDRVAFTMRNRSAEEVDISEPTLDGAPLLARDLERNLQQGTPAVAPMPHSMDFHAGMVAPNDKWRPIQPGQTIRFEWTANYPGVFLYHCGQAPVFLHMAMGQYGVVVVSPRDGYPTDDAVDREYVVIQSEFYLAEQEGSPLWAVDFDAAMARRPSHVVFNGHTRSMVEHPLVAEPGERVRFYVMNAGPDDTSSFHVMGTIFDTVYLEGNPLNVLHGMQTVLLGASSGAVVEFVVPEAGTYGFVDHEFADATRGAFGKLVAGPQSGAAMTSH